MRTHLSDEHVARRGSVGWGAVSQARDGEDGLRVERRDSLGEEDGDGISRWLSFGECCCEEIILRSLLAPWLPNCPSRVANPEGNAKRVHLSTEQPPRDALKVGFLGDRLSP